MHGFDARYVFVAGQIAEQARGERTGTGNMSGGRGRRRLQIDVCMIRTCSSIIHSSKRCNTTNNLQL